MKDVQESLSTVARSLLAKLMAESSLVALLLIWEVLPERI